MLAFRKVKELDLLLKFNVILPLVHQITFDYDLKSNKVELEWIFSIHLINYFFIGAFILPSF